MILVEWTQFLIVGLAVLLAATVHAGTGFGYAIVTMSLLPLVMPFHTAAAVEAITVCLLSTILLFRLRKHIRLRILIWPLIGAAVFMPLGINTMMGSTDPFMRRLLGGLLLLLCVYSMFFGDKLRVRPSRANGLIAGVISGFVGGMFNIAGPFLTIYFISVTEEKGEYSAALQGIFAIMAPYQVLLHFLWGNVTVQTLWFSAVAVFGVVIGSVLGFIVFQKLAMPQLKRLVFCIMAVVGVYFVLGG